MEEEWIENIKRYSESKHFLDLRRIERKLFREGNAVNLDPNLTVPLRPMPIYMSYYKKGLFNIPKFDMSSIEDICLNNNPIFEKPRKFEKQLNKTLERYFTYNK